MDMQFGPALSGEEDLVGRLRAGDAAAFTSIVRGWSPAMIHVARQYVSCQASAEETVQETWFAVIKGIDRFQGRSSLRTWVFSILANIGRRQGSKEGRTGPHLPPRRPRQRPDGRPEQVPARR